MALDRRQLNRATLARQLLIERADVAVLDAVKRIGAIQGQEPASPYIALWNRVARFEPDDLDEAFDAQRVIKASLMRITLHVVHADAYPAFRAAMEPALRASRLNDRRFTATGLSDADFDALVPGVLEYASTPRSKGEIEAALAERLGAAPDPMVWWAMRTVAPLVHAPTGGPWSFGLKPSFRCPPPAARVDTEAGVQLLVRRYLSGFGPASAKDIAQFSLLRQSTLKPALTSMADELETLESADGSTLFDLPGAERPDGDREVPPRLLPMWDSTLLAYADRRRIIPEAYRRFVIRRNGDTLPALLVDGFVAGVWRAVEGGIEVTAFAPLAAQDWDGIEAEAARLGGFLAGRDPGAHGRYVRWWNDLPGERRTFDADVG